MYKSEQIAEIRWTMTGKVSDVTRTAGSQKPDLHFAYDAMGNRISKTVINKKETENDKYVTTYYVRDPQGNVLAVYERKRGETGDGTFTLTEQHLYGASRLGMKKRDLALNVANASEPTPVTHYELTNHLGNVMAVISDEASTTDEPTVVSLSDYYPFGMTEPGRSWNAGDYRFGYTGHEKENDLAEGVYTTEYRLLDTRLGRWLSVDKMAGDFAWMSPYNYCEGNPMAFWDPDGKEKIDCFNKHFPTRQELRGHSKKWQTELINHRITNANFFDKHVYAYTKNVGVIHLWGHGALDGYAISVYDPKLKRDILYDNAVLVESLLLEKSEIYKRNNPLEENGYFVDQSKSKYSILVLHSCETGVEGGIGQQISNELNLLVVAPSNIVRCPSIGNEYVKDNGVWNIYYKGELMECFDGKTKPLFDNPEKTIEKYEKMYQERHNDSNEESSCEE